MRRREFVGGLLGAAALPVRAQQPIIGFVRSTSLSDAKHLVGAFREGLKEVGWFEGQNVSVEFREANDDPTRLPLILNDLIWRQVAVIVANGIAALAAKSLTTTVPIVFAAGGDPVEMGLVGSLNRPGANVTGVNFFNGVLGAKRLELLLQLVADKQMIAIAALVNLHTPDSRAELKDVQAAAEAIGKQVTIFDVSSDGEIETALATFVARGAGLLFVGGGGFMTSKREQIVALAASHALPSSYPERESVMSGGLMSYGTSITDAYRQTGIYTGRVLKGEKPADLPILLATKVELIINTKAARALGVTIPPLSSPAPMR